MPAIPPLVRKTLLLASFLLAVGTALYFNQDLELQAERSFSSHQHLFYLPTPKTLERFSLGYRTLFADLIWVRSLLYMGDHFSSRIKTDVSWLPAYVNSIVHLDPKFKKAYEWGSILVLYNRFRTHRKEVLQSIKFQKMGRKAFPNSYYFPYALGMSYSYEIKLYERNDEELKADYREFCKSKKVPKLKRMPLIKKIRRCLQRIGAGYILEASSKGDAPPNLALLAAKLLRRTGDNNVAICNHLLDVLWRATPEARKEIRPKLKRYCRGKTLNLILCREKEFVFNWRKSFGYISPSLFALIRPSLSFPLEEKLSPFLRKCLKEVEKK